MSKINDLKEYVVESAVIKAYGLTREQYVGYNSDYQKILVNNYYDILKKRNADFTEKTEIKQKKKTLFKKIGG